MFEIAYLKQLITFGKSVYQLMWCEKEFHKSVWISLLLYQKNDKLISCFLVFDNFLLICVKGEEIRDKGSIKIKIKSSFGFKKPYVGFQKLK